MYLCAYVVTGHKNKPLWLRSFSFYLHINQPAMKKLIFFLLTFCSTSMAFAQSKDSAQKKPIDEIRKYWFVLLKTGPNRNQDSATAVALQKAHLDNIDRLYYEGVIKVAGPFGEKGDWRGIFIMDVPTKEEAEKLLQTDPMISVGRLAYEIKPWYTAPIGSFVPGKPKKD